MLGIGGLVGLSQYAEIMGFKQFGFAMAIGGIFVLVGACLSMAGACYEKVILVTIVRSLKTRLFGANSVYNQ